ncbi:hypothetical protein HG537_0A03500 [Torulaspora globosa]|uniref:Cytochrome b560 subunit of succinate dehydrogenase n=1 Tax=Torulaspora globosa TaxID=48254 RepID=A0A7H9HLD8_9SACH|nr:hypothetical protein HG537_0A03500 [Torulaspora sp. CBS 2947]
MFLCQLGLIGSPRGALRSGVVVSRASRAVLGKRFNSQTVKTSFQKEQEILVAQRRNRPVSPHLTIYQPQLTWYLSSLHRITGVLLGSAFFAVTMAFGVSTLFGLGLNTEKLKQYYREKVPRWADWTIKGSAAYMFAFHFGNGIRHLLWDTGRELTIKGVNRTGIAVLVLTAFAGTSFLFW